MLLHCILRNRGINLGKLIEKEILACAFKPKGCLFFPSLITELCLQSGLEISSTDELLLNIGEINTTAIKQFALPTGKSVPSKVPPIGETRDLVAQVQHLTKLLQHNILQQQAFGEFSKVAHIWQKRTFELNFKNMVINSPAFPDTILQPFV